MGTTTDKLNKILESKAAIKAAIEAKGVSDVGDVLATYPDKIASIKSGGYTGHADVEGLKAIGWTDEDIEYYQTHGVNWNEEDDEYHKVPQDNIDLYSILTLDNIDTYKDRIVYFPKIDTSSVKQMSYLFYDWYTLISIPQLDTSNVTSMDNMFSGCCCLTSVPQLNTSNVMTMSNMFYGCYSLISIPQLNTNSVMIMSNMFSNCYSLTSIPKLDTSNVMDMSSIFDGCNSLILISQLDISGTTSIYNMFNNCYSIQTVRLKGLKTELEIKPALYLTKESLVYIIENAASTEPITITLNAYCYNKYNTDPDVVTALAKQSNVLLAST